MLSTLRREREGEVDTEPKDKQLTNSHCDTDGEQELNSDLTSALRKKPGWKAGDNFAAVELKRIITPDFI